MGSKRWSNASTTPDRSTGVPIGLRSSQTCSDRAELRDGPALAEVVLANEEHDRAHGLEGVLQHDPLQVSVVGTAPVLGRKVTLPLRLFRMGERSAMTPGKAAIAAISDYAQERGASFSSLARSVASSHELARQTSRSTTSAMATACSSGIPVADRSAGKGRLE